jgi:hypothetical protein
VDVLANSYALSSMEDLETIILLLISTTLTRISIQIQAGLLLHPDYIREKFHADQTQNSYFKQYISSRLWE